MERLIVVVAPSLNQEGNLEVDGYHGTVGGREGGHIIQLWHAHKTASIGIETEGSAERTATILMAKLNFQIHVGN